MLVIFSICSFAKWWGWSNVKFSAKCNLHIFLQTCVGIKWLWPFLITLVMNVLCYLFSFVEFKSLVLRFMFAHNFRHVHSRSFVIAISCIYSSVWGIFLHFYTEVCKFVYCSELKSLYFDSVVLNSVVVHFLCTYTIAFGTS